MNLFIQTIGCFFYLENKSKSMSYYSGLDKYGSLKLPIQTVCLSICLCVGRRDRDDR